MNRKRILLVDDDLELLRVLEVHCRKIGLDVYTARNAVTAVTLLEEKKPDLICLDMNVPGGNGLKLCEMMLASPDDVTCPVIILTGRADGAAKRLRAEMCVYYVQKRPHMWRYLEPVIYELIDIRPVARRPNATNTT
jgi:DNA-binding response OmpR family regulator